MAGKRLTRKEIQEDQIHDVLHGTYTWITENRNTLLIGFAILLALVAGTYAFQEYRQAHNSRLQTALSDAIKVLEAPLNGEEPPVEPGHEGHDHVPSNELTFATAQERDQRALEEFTKIAENYSGPIAEFATFYASVANDRLGKTREAEQALKRLTSNAGTPAVKSLAYNYLAFLGEKENNWDLVTDSLRKLADSPSQNFPRDNALYRLAQALERSGNRSEALETYRKLAAEFPQSPNFRQVNSRIDVLSAILGDSAEAEAPEKNPEGAEEPGR